MLYYVPLKYTETNAGTISTRTYDFPAKLDYTKEKALCLFPMNSCCILDQTRVNIGGNCIEDAFVNRTKSIVQQKFPKDYQEMASDTFFETENLFSYDVWNVNNDNAIPLLSSATAYSDNVSTPGLYKNSTTVTKGYFVFYKTFMIPLCLLNTVFDIGQMPFFISGP